MSEAYPLPIGSAGRRTDATTAEHPSVAHRPAALGAWHRWALAGA